MHRYANIDRQINTYDSSKTSILSYSSDSRVRNRQQEPTRTKNAAGGARFASNAERKVLRSHRRYVVVVSSSRVWDPGGDRQNARITRSRTAN